jgi:hypothetical protein
MSIRTIAASATAIALAAIAFTAPANAIPLLCQDTAVNHMYVDTSYVSSCEGAGVGNINGNPGTDDFLMGEGAGSGLVGIGTGTFTQTGNTGTFSLDSSLWDQWGSIAVGFKFGTGNQPDEWFVFLLNSATSSGTWEFVNVFNRGGGLSHVQLYGSGDSTHVPEPGTLGLLGLGLIATTLIRRRNQI